MVDCQSLSKNNKYFVQPKDIRIASFDNPHRFCLCVSNLELIGLGLYFQEAFLFVAYQTDLKIIHLWQWLEDWLFLLALRLGLNLFGLVDNVNFIFLFLTDVRKIVCCFWLLHYYYKVKNSRAFCNDVFIKIG